MRKIMFLIPVVLGVTVVALGCGSGGDSADQTATKSADQAATKSADATPATDMAEDTQGSNPQTAEGRGAGAGYESPGRNPAATPAMLATASFVVSGQLGCGHCSFHIKEECSLALKTEDGEIYMIEAGDRQEELMDHRLDEPSAKVVGQVTEVDGQKIIHTANVELF